MIEKEYINEIIRISQEVYENEKATPVQIDLYNSYPHIFVLACVMDRQIDADRAWKIPLNVAEELGSKSFNAFLSKDREYYINLFNTKKYHRFNQTMGEYFYDAIQLIHNKYNDNASNIWKANPNSAQVVCRFLEFNGVGIKIATMAVNILSRDYKVPMTDMSAIDISPDRHVKRCMYRLGLIPERKEHDFLNVSETEIVYAAKAINPSFPGLMDLAFYYMGSKGYCENNSCDKEKCLFGKICKRQGY